jgi:hypothetical protein
VLHAKNRQRLEALEISTTHGGYGFATEYDVERKFRESRVLTVAPVSNNLVLGVSGTACVGHAEVVLMTRKQSDLPPGIAGQYGVKPIMNVASVTLERNQLHCGKRWQ